MIFSNNPKSQGFRNLTPKYKYTFNLILLFRNFIKHTTYIVRVLRGFDHIQYKCVPHLSNNSPRLQSNRRTIQMEKADRRVFVGPNEQSLSNQMDIRL